MKEVSASKFNAATSRTAPGTSWPLAAGLLLIAALLAATGCGKKAAAESGGGGMAVPVIAVEAKLQPVIESLSLVGSILANELVEIKSEADGTVQDIKFTEGQQVKKGDLLIQFDETKFTTALAEAESNFKLSKATFERAQQLSKSHLISQQEYDQAAATFELNRATVDRRQRDLKDTRIYAPFSGVVGARIVSPGQVIARDTRMTVLVDLDPVKVEISLPERFLGQVHVGQELELSVAAFPAGKFRGKVYFVAPEVDPTTRTAVIKAQIPNPQQELRPGMFANLELTLKVRDQAVVIPESALVSQQDKTSVWVVGADETARPRPVVIGVRMPGLVEIIQGLQSGEKVITEGTQKVSPGGKVKAS
jgi:membrane fusion protein (multidrug efflux system)